MKVGHDALQKKLTEFGFPKVQTKLKLKEPKQKQQWHSDMQRVNTVLRLLPEEKYSDRNFVFGLRAYLLRNPDKKLTPRQKSALNMVIERNQI